MQQNFDKFIDLVWPANGDFDSPLGGYHVTPGDSGGGTKGGVIESTWATYVKTGLVRGTLATATDCQLKSVLYAAAWGATGNALPSGLDILIGNGRMMTGRYTEIVQENLGFVGKDVDNNFGPLTLAKAQTVADVKTFCAMLNNAHLRYLSGLASWTEFGHGWTRRLDAALAAALAAI